MHWLFGWSEDGLVRRLVGWILDLDGWLVCVWYPSCVKMCVHFSLNVIIYLNAHSKDTQQPPPTACITANSHLALGVRRSGTGVQRQEVQRHLPELAGAFFGFARQQDGGAGHGLFGF